MASDHYLILAKNGMDLLLPQQEDLLTVGPIQANNDKDAKEWAESRYWNWHIATDEEISAWQLLWDF